MLPQLTSLECALALQRLGFELESVNEKRMSLRRKDGRRVFVPRHAALLPAHVRAILQVAGVTEDELAAVLPPGGTSGMFTRPDVAGKGLAPVATRTRKGG